MRAEDGVANTGFNRYNALDRVFQRVLYFVQTPQRAFSAAAHIFPICTLPMNVLFFRTSLAAIFTPSDLADGLCFTSE